MDLLKYKEEVSQAFITWLVSSGYLLTLINWIFITQTVLVPESGFFVNDGIKLNFGDEALLTLYFLGLNPQIQHYIESLQSLQ